MERWLAGITGPSIESDLSDCARGSESLGIALRGWRTIRRSQVVLDRQRVVEESDLIAVSAEEEKAGEQRMNIIYPKLHAVPAAKNRNIVAKLKLPLFGLLRDVHIGATLDRGKHNIRVGGHSQNIVLEILELKRELVHRPRTKSIGVTQDKTVKLVVVCVSA